MTKITYIPGEIANAAIDEHGNRKPVTRTQHIFDDVEGKSQAEVNKENKERLDELEETVGDGGSVDERIAEEGAKHYLKTETYNKTELNNMITTPNQQYVSVTATSQTTSATDVLPTTGAADTTYRVGNWDGTQYNDSVFSEYAWNGSAYIKLSTKSQVGEVYDISANHADTKYADLAAALGTNGANVPVGVRKGGMSIKFIQSSDNKYVQFRYMSSSTAVADFTNVVNWQGVDSEPLAGSKNLVESGGVAKYLFNISKQDNKYVDSQGNLVSDNSWFVLEYELTEPIKANDVFFWSGITTNYNVCAGFWNNDTYLAGASAIGDTRTIVLTSDKPQMGANKLKVSFLKSKESEAFIKINDRLIYPEYVVKEEELERYVSELGSFASEIDSRSLCGYFEESNIDNVKATGVYIRKKTEEQYGAAILFVYHNPNSILIQQVRIDAYYGVRRRTYNSSTNTWGEWDLYLSGSEITALINKKTQADNEPIPLSQNLVKSRGVAKYLFNVHSIDNNYVTAGGVLVPDNNWFVVGYALDEPIKEGDIIVWSGITTNYNVCFAYYIDDTYVNAASAIGDTRTLNIGSGSQLIGSNRLKVSYLKAKADEASFSINGTVLQPEVTTKIDDLNVRVDNLQLSIKAVAIPSSSQALSYQGEPIINKSYNKIYGQGIITGWQGGEPFQGFAIYGNYGVLLSGYHYDIYRLDEDNPVKISSFVERDTQSQENCHGNCAMFARNVESGNDFPYLYIGEYFGKVLNVENIGFNNSTLLQTITIGNDVPLVGALSDANVLLGDDGYIYCFGTNIEINPAKMYLVKFRQVAISEGNITLTASDVSDYFELDINEVFSYTALQGSKIYDGYLYQQFGGSASTEQLLLKINIKDRKIVSRINFYDFAPNEVEDFDIDFFDGIIYTNVMADFMVKTKV